MFPLPVGGNGVLRTTAAISGVSSQRFCSRLRSLRLGSAAVVSACAIAATAVAAETSARVQQAAIVNVIAPVSAGRPDTADWTQRSLTVAQASAEPQKAQTRIRPQAQVAMFSWRELMFYAMGAVIVVAGLLAFTAGGGRHRSRHS